MVDQFNYQVIDLRKQIDTTDTYIENYLPFRTLKEVSQLLENSFDRSVNHKIKAFEAERIKELYARMIQTIHKLPDFKVQLMVLKTTKGKNLPGFRNIRETSPTKYNDKLERVSDKED